MGCDWSRDKEYFLQGAVIGHMSRDIPIEGLEHPTRNIPIEGL
jgi:hypothetical protein